MLAEGPMIDAFRVTLAAEDDFDGWRDAARGLAEAGVPAQAIVWQVEGGEPNLFAAGLAPPATGPSFAVPRAFIDMAKAAICNRDPERFALLYALLLKLRSNRHAMDDRADPLLDRLERLAKEVRRDAHKMHAFVRFREVEDSDGARFVAWFEPDHHIVRREAGFFIRRFANMRWSILTPELTIHWDGTALTEGPGAVRRDAPDGDPVEETWKTYYASIFNPARVKVKAMTKEMPKKYWKNMPETALIGGLIAAAQNRETAMIETSRSQAPLPVSNLDASWDALRAEAAGCTRCDSTNAPPRRCSAKDRSTPRSSSLASSQVTRRISPGVRSWARRARCSMPRWPRPGSTARRPMSPTRSSISSSSCAARNGSTRAPTRGKLTPAAGGRSKNAG